MVQNLETKQFAIGNKGLLIFGIILLLIGLVASFYVDVKTLSDPFYGYEWEISRTYPYQNVGIVLVLAGIVFIGIGFFYPPRKRETA